jgi:hypothetical protein
MEEKEEKKKKKKKATLSGEDGKPNIFITLLPFCHKCSNKLQVSHYTVVDVSQGGNHQQSSKQDSR